VFFVLQSHRRVYIVVVVLVIKSKRLDNCIRVYCGGQRNEIAVEQQHGTRRLLFYVDTGEVDSVAFCAHLRVVNFSLIQKTGK
jgi:hypothetical protein